MSFTTPVLSTVATPTTHVDLSGSLPGNSQILSIGTSPPSGTTYSFKRSVEANDDKGLSLPLDVYLTRVEEKKWLVSAYDGSNAGAFPATPLMSTEIEFVNFGQQQTFSGSLTIPGGQFTDLSFSLIQRAATTPPVPPDITPNLSVTDDGHVEFDPFAYSKKSSISVVNNVGQKTNLDLYFKKTGPDMWIVNTYDAANASSYPATPLSHDVLRFDGNGRLSKGGPLSVAVPNGQTMKIDITALTQLASGTALSGTANGMEPTAMTGMAFGSDGTVYATFADGTRAATYKVPLADVASSDNLTPRAGNVYATSPASGDVQIGFAGQGSRGTLKSKALEQSNVDVSSELTSMIEAQTIYTASSKVFMTGTELLEAIVNLKR